MGPTIRPMPPSPPANTGKRFGYAILAMICATVVLYACGVTWLKILTGMTWSKTMMAGMYPFLVGDVLKIVAAALIAKALRPVIRLPGSELRVTS